MSEQIVPVHSHHERVVLEIDVQMTVDKLQLIFLQVLDKG